MREGSDSGLTAPGVLVTPSVADPVAAIELDSLGYRRASGPRRWGSNLPPTEISTGHLKEFSGGERGIRTLEGLLTLTPLAGVRLRPLGHLSDYARFSFGVRDLHECTRPFPGRGGHHTEGGRTR